MAWVIIRIFIKAFVKSANACLKWLYITRESARSVMRTYNNIFLYKKN